MILIWGIDSADWSVLNPLMERGELPALAQLVDSGASGTLRSTIPAYTGIALPTILTGKNPGTTGMVGFEKVDGQLNDFSDVDSETFWETAGRQGKETCIVNVRTTYPPREVENGWLVSGDLYTPPDADGFVSPPDLLDEFPELASFHASLGRLDELQREGATREFAETAVEATRTRHTQFEALVAEKQPDMAMFWIGNADKLQHLAWGEEVVEKYYRAIDELLQQTLGRFDPETTYVLSDHGHEAVYERELHLNTWLAEEGYLQTTTLAPLSKRIGPLVSKFGPEWLKESGRKLSDALKRTGSEQATPSSQEEGNQQFGQGRNVTIPGIDYGESKAVLANEWGIDVLADGDERTGIVDEIVRKLRRLQFQGENAIRFAAPREEVYTEPYREAFPDIIVLPSRNFHANHTLANTITSKTGGSTHTAGYHIYDPDGIFVAVGDGIDVESDVEFVAEEFGPTVLRALGVAIPADVDGKPVDRFVPSERRGQAVETITAVRRGADRSGDVDGRVEQRLEDMGYL